MTNKFIAIEILPTKAGIGGSFMAAASFKLDHILAPFSNIPVKIDTGCSISTIPLARFQGLNEFCDLLKVQDIENQIPYEISYGIESGGIKHSRPVTFEEKMQCPAMKFRHTIMDFHIANIPIQQNTIYVNYNRKGNILIGMDILQNWDIHIGTRRITNKNLFLACPKPCICQEYYDALEKNFGINRK